MRPINETQHDRDREQEVARRLQSMWQCKMRKLEGMTYPADFGAFRSAPKITGVGDELASLVEIKYRDKLIFPFLISMHKLHRMRLYAKEWNIPAIIAVGHGDQIIWHAIDQDYVYGIRWGGNSRGQMGDKEPVALIPADLFKSLPQRKQAA